MKIVIEGIKLHAFHGCLAEEAKIGGSYIIDIILEADFILAAHTDDLSKTVDYCTVYDLVKVEMAIRSKLIEHVARRIYMKLKTTFPSINKLEVKVTKLNPPVNGEMERVSFVIND